MRVLVLSPWLSALFMGIVASGSMRAQSGGFVMTLGADTVQVEQFTRTGQQITGLLVTRAPKAHVVHYDITLGADGRISRYEQTHTNGDGSTATPDPGRATMTYLGDSIVREALQRDGTPVTHRIATPGGAWPLSTIPIGSSFLMFEFALATARTTPMAAQPTLNRLLAMAAQPQASHTRLLYTAPDSVDVDYFGQGRFGFKFDADGRIVRSDWRNTTYRVLVSRVARIDASAIARGWAAQDAAGTGSGPLSPRDSVVTTVGDANIAIYYARPARRGRAIWGTVVPWNQVWRLGADFATQFKTDKDLMIGDTLVPAGEYTLWMYASSEAPQLIVSKLVKVFGTQYNPNQDFARIPLKRGSLQTPVDRFTLSVRDQALHVDWDAVSYEVPLRLK